MYMYLQKQFSWTLEKFLPFRASMTLLHGSLHWGESFTTCNYTDISTAFVYKYYFSHRSRNRCVRAQRQTTNSRDVYCYRYYSHRNFRKDLFRVLDLRMAIIRRGSCWKHRVCNTNVDTIDHIINIT